MTRADYMYSVHVDARDRPVIALVDLCAGKSVTNDAENVIADFVRAGVNVDAYRFVYRDTDGVWDELLVRESRFAGFAALRVRSLDEALASVARSH